MLTAAAPPGHRCRRTAFRLVGPTSHHTLADAVNQTPAQLVVGGVMTVESGTTGLNADAPSFEEFVSSRGSALLRSAIAIAGNREAAEDLVQEALIRALGHWEVVGRSDPEPYVRKILVHLVIDRSRRLRSKRNQPETGPQEGADPFTMADDRDLLLRALRELPTRQRTVLALRYWDDLTEQQIAEAMRCSVGSVKTHAARGLAALRRAQSKGGTDE